MHTITLGRRPTLGEAINYYSQEEFLLYVQDALRARRVVLVIPQKKHWEPNWEKDEVRPQDVDGLRSWFLDRVAACVPQTGVNDYPEYYPAFHQSVIKGPSGQPCDPRIMDCVFEADPASWRDAFRDVGPIIALLERYGVPYQAKFSGHRSLHMTLPAEVIPPGCRGRGTKRLAHELLSWSNSQAHHLPRITRMPYSLNEDTGLVCLPIEPGHIASFRPWQANLHLVDIPRHTQDTEITETHQECLRRLLEDLKDETEFPKSHRITPERPILASHSPADVLTTYRDRIRHLDSDGPVGNAWTRLVGNTPVTVSDLLQGLSQKDPDAVWLTVEAFLFHSSDITPPAFQALLAQEEEYAQASATDALLKYEGAITSLVVQALRDVNSTPSVGARAAYLLAQSASLRQAVSDTMLIDAGGTYDARILVACMTGAASGDWTLAAAILEPIGPMRELPPEERARLRRKTRAVEIMGSIGGANKEEEDEKARRLVALGPEITELLLIAAQSPAPRFRRGIVSALAARADPRAAEALIRALNDDYTKVRQRAIAGLIRIGRPAVAALIDAADSDQVRIRRYALLCLGRIASSDPQSAIRAKPVIAGALSDREEVVIRVAIRAMVDLATLDDLEAVLVFLRDAQPEDAIEATQVVEALGAEGAAALRTMALEERVPAAAYFVSRQGDPLGRGILADQLLSEATRKVAVEYLRELRDTRCVPYLVEELRGLTDWRGSWLAQELGVVGGDAAVSALIETLSRDVQLIRRGAVRGLDTAKHPAAIPALINALEDADAKVRRLAAEALEHHGEAAIAQLRDALAQTDALNSRRRTILAQLLGRMGKTAPGAQR